MLCRAEGCRSTRTIEVFIGIATQSPEPDPGPAEVPLCEYHRRLLHLGEVRMKTDEELRKEEEGT